MLWYMLQPPLCSDRQHGRDQKGRRHKVPACQRQPARFLCNYYQCHENYREPLRLREAPHAGTIRIAARKLEEEATEIVGDNIPSQCAPSRFAIQDQQDANDHYAGYPNRFDKLNWKQCHSDIVIGETGSRVLWSVANSPM